MLPPLLISPHLDFWQVVAQHVSYEQQSLHNYQVMVPAFAHAQNLKQALAARSGQAMLAPQIHTLNAWLALQVPLPVASQSQRLLGLYAELRQHHWLRQLFGAHDSIDLLPLANTLLTLCDELSVALLPQVAGYGDPSTGETAGTAPGQRPASARLAPSRLDDALAKRWQSALQQLPAPARRIISDEAQLVWSIWQAQLDSDDPALVRWHTLLQLAGRATRPLLWIHPVAPDAQERQFLQIWATRAPVRVITLDWGAASVAPLLAHAWPELLERDTMAQAEPCAEPAQGEMTPDAATPDVATPPFSLQHCQLCPANSLEHEAQQGALCLLNWLQQGKTRLALVAQDRVVARRIRALLERAGVSVQDETGWKLSTTRAASAIMAWLEVVASNADVMALLDLLKSPFVLASVKGKADQVMQLELAWRRNNVLGGWTAMLAGAGAALRRADLVSRDDLASRDESGEPALATEAGVGGGVIANEAGVGGGVIANEAGVGGGVIANEAGVEAGLEARANARPDTRPGVLAGLYAMARQAAQYTGHKTASQWCELCLSSMELLGLRNALDQDMAGQQLLALLANISAACQNDPSNMALAEWRALLALQLESSPFVAESPDARIVMLPLNGARLRRFEAALVVGCDAKALPSQPSEVLFFANAVRRELALATRETRQQQQMRDLAEVLCAGTPLVLSWQQFKNDEPNPPSPWLERLQLLLAQNHAQLIRHCQFPLPLVPLQAQRGSMARPVAASLMPSDLSASSYQRFLACPYAWYAAYGLGLTRVDAFADLPEKRDYGDWLHGILHDFHQQLSSQQLSSQQLSDQQPGQPPMPATDPAQLLGTLSRLRFEQELNSSAAALGYWVRWQQAMPAYLQWLQAHQDAGWQYQAGEQALSGTLSWPGGGMTLKGRIDRIDQHQDGQHMVIDYKTGSNTTLRAKVLGEDVQLAFYGLLAPDTDQAVFLGLEPKDGKLTAHAKQPWPEAVTELRQQLQSHMQAVAQGAPLPANGVDAACQYCDMRGLCRKGSWQ
jgi:ATP-dependent helicase/nuclease subunit B